MSAVSCALGQAWPMGASCLTWQGRAGVNFAVYSPHAQRLVVCLFDAQGVTETARCVLPVCSHGVWHGFVAGLGVGQLYGLRAYGPYQPTQGWRFNPAKLLIDPFARALVGDTQYLSRERDYLGPTLPGAAVLDARPDPVDNAARVPKAQVLDWHAEYQAGAAMTPRASIPLAQTVIYEAHVKGLTQRHPQVPASLRGRYAGLVSAPMLAHYRRLGITTLCLLPVQLSIAEAHLLNKGLSNYWGYNPLAYFVPEPRYASGLFADDRAEFRYMVDQLHQHGLEVVLDVVYNHSAESDTFGPTLSWRGLDNASWYALDEAGQYLNFSGCGNSLNLGQPGARQLVLESLHWWVRALGVDGFRFDLATALGRDANPAHAFHATSLLLTAITQDPVLAGLKLIAEPWDLGPNGYQLGQFPAGWHEWNDRFRDTSRAFWLGFGCTRGDLAQRLAGSSDKFAHDGRSPLSSLNLITAHDGMTLADLTSFSHKHNEANGEDNRDGCDHNLSANAGIEGPTQDAAVLGVRADWRRALLTTLLCAQGTPQLLAGDELGHTQKGNNNAYSQDNDITWLDWVGADDVLTTFVARLIHLRQAHAALHPTRWCTPEEMVWRNPDGSALSTGDWNDPSARSLACLIEVAEAAGQVACERWLLMFHAAPDSLSFVLPPGRWLPVLDSAAAQALSDAEWASVTPVSDTCLVSARSIVGLVQPFAS